MTLYTLLIVIFVQMIGACGLESQVAKADLSPKIAAKECSKNSMLVINLFDHDSTHIGLSHRFQCDDGVWKKIAEPHKITIGKNGLAWSKSAITPKSATLKKEGDLKSPSGVFDLRSSFGNAPIDQAENLQFPYFQIGAFTQCIEDQNSLFYNQIVKDNRSVDIDYVQKDFMLRNDDLYKWGIFVEHNIDQISGDGSCIFIHLWKDENAHTAGCTAMSEANIFSLMHWLKIEDNPQMIQMTRSEYNSMYKLNGWPSI